jgi:hypothetical protein
MYLSIDFLNLMPYIVIIDTPRPRDKGASQGDTRGSPQSPSTEPGQTSETKMTNTEAQRALENHTKVEGGKGEDHDTGYILAINADNIALVGWDSGVRTPCHIADLKEI